MATLGSISTLPTTVRERAIVGLAELLQSIAKDGTPVDANGITLAAPFNYPYGDQFSAQSVYREPPDAIAGGRRAVAIITEGVEQESELSYGMVECQLVVFVEAHVLRQPSENMSTLLNGFMGIIGRAVRASRTYGVAGVVDTTLHGSDKRLSGGPYANYGDCVVKMTIHYRHITNDPCLTPGYNLEDTPMLTDESGFVLEVES